MRTLFQSPLLALVAGAALAGSAVAQDAENNPWVPLTGNDSVQWYGKFGSGQLVNVDGKQSNGFGYVYQKEEKNQKTYSYGKVFVMLQACKKGFGYLMYNDLEGNYTGRDPFVRFGTTVADGLASAACRTWDDANGKVSAVASDPLWEHAATSEKTNNQYLLKTDSVRQRQYNKVAALSGLYAFKNLKNNTTNYSEFVITLKTCNTGVGVIYELDFDGKQEDKFDVVIEGNSVIAAVANNLCSKRKSR